MDAKYIRDVRATAGRRVIIYGASGWWECTTLTDTVAAINGTVQWYRGSSSLEALCLTRSLGASESMIILPYKLHYFNRGSKFSN